MKTELNFTDHDAFDYEVLLHTYLGVSDVRNVEVRHADGAAGSAADGPFDVIVFGGSLPVFLDAAMDWLAPAGKVFAIIGSAPATSANAASPPQ